MLLYLVICSLCSKASTLSFSRSLSLITGSSELFKHYSQKVALEQELPNITQKLRTTNECLLSSLASLSNITKKVSQKGALGSLHLKTVIRYSDGLVQKNVSADAQSSDPGIVFALY